MGNLVTLISVSAAIAGVIYNWAFFRAIDSAFFATLSIEDHVASALSWLPGSVFAFIVGMSYRIVSGEKMFDPAQKPDGMDNDLFTNKVKSFYRVQNAKVSLGVAGMIIGYIFFDFYAVALPFFVFWHGVKEIVLTKHDLPLNMTFLVEIAPVAAMAVALHGFADGNAALKSETQTAIVDLKDVGLKQGTLLRTGKSGVIVLEENRNIVFYPTERIVSVAIMASDKMIAKSKSKK